MKAVVLHPAAERELAEVTSYFEAVDSALAEAFTACILQYSTKLAANPQHFSIRRGLVRRANLLPRFGEYYLPFMVWRDRVVILAIAHAKRRPYYWRNRINDAKRRFGGDN
ncbi:type II toxin-antitoxin system RelE/ParE family toxin [Roseimicrobium sp. ORNL1]|uniref:type II toxin-antitoxin system RelE/ParE family toxin n=1 Tax=Roseimicrobium sp. ORNL1 TaxID=2711231 RepID=UPI0013E1C609|nr:type II toxin-antitoxin system RelE/ParE family toxin [Roseimicrobium sp. ORNL1]QIF05521.1 type II toxin-antitoxin system RelE/ParE family toxin [Roseimicrobium sp. ORNL1]